MPNCAPFEGVRPCRRDVAQTLHPPSGHRVSGGERYLLAGPCSAAPRACAVLGNCLSLLAPCSDRSPEMRAWTRLVAGDLAHSIQHLRPTDWVHLEAVAAGSYRDGEFPWDRRVPAQHVHVSVDIAWLSLRAAVAALPDSPACAGGFADGDHVTGQALQIDHRHIAPASHFLLNLFVQPRSSQRFDSQTVGCGIQICEPRAIEQPRAQGHGHRERDCRYRQPPVQWPLRGDGGFMHTRPGVGT